MRENKFRIYSKAEKRWIYFKLTDCFSKSFGLFLPRGLKEETLTEFTGLKNKNGKEIYEGDILHYKARDFEFTGEVIFDDGGFVIKNNLGTYELCQLVINSSDIMEIVGNI